MRILLVDDDEQLMEMLATNLIKQRYAVDIANTGEIGWEFIVLFDFDLIVLDWMLPDIDGVTMCQQIRDAGYTMPIMLLTARDRHRDRVQGLDAGADDYMVKPCNFDELTARIRALLRRDIKVASTILQWENLTLDPKTHEVHQQEQLLPLTPKEYNILELFMRHPQQVFSPGAIIDHLWAGENTPGEESVRTHIKGLRQKLKAAGLDKDTIKNVYGVGYRLKSESDQEYDPQLTGEHRSAQAPNRSAFPCALRRRGVAAPFYGGVTLTHTAESKSEELEIITQTWLRFKDSAFERLAVLENLALALKQEPIALEIFTQGIDSAHKLAGSLGCFGFTHGSDIAKQLERLLADYPLAQAEQAKTKQITELIATLQAELQQQPWESTVRDALTGNVSLLIIDDDPDFSQRLVSQTFQNGMKPNLASNVEQAKEIIAQEQIAAVLHKITFPDGEDLAFIEELHQQLSQLPIVTIAKSAQLRDRLEIVRKGGNLTLQYPIEPRIAINSVTELLKSTGATAKILIVDDDPQILLSLEISLQPWGFKLTTLAQPQHFWEVLEDCEPDLLILDIEMPQINGIELCQILRSDRRWQYLPVLFLSVHQDEQTQYRAFAIGADDYISKPVTGARLANRILNRLRRSRTTNY